MSFVNRNRFKEALLQARLVASNQPLAGCVFFARRGGWEGVRLTRAETAIQKSLFCQISPMHDARSGHLEVCAAATFPFFDQTFNKTVFFPGKVKPLMSENWKAVSVAKVFGACLVIFFRFRLKIGENKNLWSEFSSRFRSIDAGREEIRFRNSRNWFWGQKVRSVFFLQPILINFYKN